MHAVTSVLYKMWSNQVYSYLLTGISGFGTFSNFKSFAYIRKTFDTTNNLFNILAKDSLATAICSGIFCTTNIIKLLDEDLFTSELGCVVHFAGVYLPGMLGPISSLMISVRRFIQLKYPNSIAHNSQRANLMVSALLALMAFIYLSFLVFDTFTESKGFNFMEVCQGHLLEQPEGSQSSLILFIVFLPTVATMGATIGLDTWIHHLATQNNFLDGNAGVVVSEEDRQRREKIPKRATIINTCLFVPWIVYTAIVGNGLNLDLQTKTLLVTVPNAIVNSLRNPLIGRLAFHVNEQIIRQTVEDRRNLEIEAALKKREERRRQKEDQQGQGNEQEEPTQEHIITVSQMVEKPSSPQQHDQENDREEPNPEQIITVSQVVEKPSLPRPRQWSMPSIHI